ncbi:MAG: UDP-N-acetylglucosamine--N-acetylmuramyl-(pentapeptide) pyrophosphoryl-undecaprenol N-acetylglucosamine transferase [Actinomycetota bacterium]|nr:UDP-N-acetylglucosamine--N-acetylmuramyl-(pentapeptide) pyrophosphoryl-undecaprenol N-acetylglucosamine transferase [Actinomycetota bacterium]
MTYVIAAAGTGGHVYPGLSVGEALLDLGVARESITFVGGNRLEAKVYPDEGFSFFEVELRGLQRSLTPRNLTLPAVVMKARSRIYEMIVESDVKAVLGMGGYVTIPTGSAARRAGVPFFNAEQNAEAGLANKIASRWAARSFVSFPDTGGMPDAEWVGNPVRAPFWSFDRESLRLEAARKYQLTPNVPVLGVFGGSLGAGAINEAIIRLVSEWEGRAFQIVHLTGERNIAEMMSVDQATVRWIRVAFEESMETFYAACDLVIARAGGAVAELTASSTPSILVPGEFGSAGHQSGNARFLSDAGAAITLPESGLGGLGGLVNSILFSDPALDEMREAANRIARPRAAHAIAAAMMKATA